MQKAEERISELDKRSIKTSQTKCIGNMNEENITKHLRTEGQLQK